MKINFNNTDQVSNLLESILEFSPESLEKRNRKGFDYINLKNKINQNIIIPTSKQIYPDMISYDNIIIHIRTMITHIGDMSNLILDPDLNTYYLMDVSLLAIPDLEDKIQELQSLILHTDFNKDLSIEELSHINILIKNIKEIYFSRITNSTKTSIIEDKNTFGGTLSLSGELQKNMTY